jgi:hypothetical protein
MKLLELCKKAEEKADKNIVNYFIYVYQMIEKEPEDQGRYFRQFVELYRDMFEADREAQNTILAQKTLMEGMLRFEKMVLGYIDYLTQCRFTEDEFYQRLWEFIQRRELFPEEDDRSVAFLICMKNRVLPYYCMPEGIQMEDGEFRERWTRLKIQREKIDFVMNHQYLQKTERASRIISVFQELPDERDKAILMVGLLDMVDGDDDEAEE